eukprot:scaffold15740_cov67-Skeletonema_dohrnii-CCMP3373.AAC.1
MSSTSEEKKIDPMPTTAAESTTMPLIEKAPTPLRICCYGSSSSRTPKKYTDAAYNLGYHLAQRGHTCVNGAGNAGGYLCVLICCKNDDDGSLAC